VSRVIENSFSVTPTLVPAGLAAAAAAALGLDAAEGLVVLLVPPHAASRTMARDAITTRPPAVRQALFIQTSLVIETPPVISATPQVGCRFL
jgi:hypothetical protein